MLVGNDVYLKRVERHRAEKRLEQLKPIRNDSAIEDSLLFQKLPSKRKARMKRECEIQKLSKVTV